MNSSPTAPQGQGAHHYTTSHDPMQGPTAPAPSGGIFGPAMPPGTSQPASRREALRPVVAFSIAVFVAAALVAALVNGITGYRFMLAFIYLRWSVVTVLFLAPLAHRLVPWLPMPYVFRTPMTAIVLTCESILIDIVSARMH